MLLFQVMKQCGTMNSFERRLAQVIIDYAETRDSKALADEKGRVVELKGQLAEAKVELADYKRVIGGVIGATSLLPETDFWGPPFVEFVSDNATVIEAFYDTIQDLVFNLCPFCCHVKNMHEFCYSCYREIECQDWCNAQYYPLQTCSTCQKRNCVACAPNCCEGNDAA